VTDREKWLNGWERTGDTVAYGNGLHCAGCGRCHGVFTVDLSGLPDGYVSPPEPLWPFNEDDCPVCGKKKQPDLKERLARFKAAKQERRGCEP
jgi:hypothetical protein